MTPLTLADVLRNAEVSHLKLTLLQCGWSRNKAAKLLGISRKNLWEKLKKYGISEADAPAPLASAVSLSVARSSDGRFEVALPAEVTK